jgi:hypothetical protein
MHEDHRRECEARDWLRRGYTTPAKVEQLLTLIEQKRGPHAAHDLRAEMRRQWARRREWMTP